MKIQLILKNVIIILRNSVSSLHCRKLLKCFVRNENVKILILILTWYFISSLNNIIGKTILTGIQNNSNSNSLIRNFLFPRRSAEDYLKPSSGPDTSGAGAAGEVKEGDKENLSPNKYLLPAFSFPLTLTLIQLICINIYSLLFRSFNGTTSNTPFTIKYLFETLTNKNNINNNNTNVNKINCYYLIFLSIGKFVSSIFSHFSIWLVSVSYAHTVKASMPLFTVFLTRFLFGERHSGLIYLSLLPIISGVSVATITELTFDPLGLLSAIFATCGFSLQNLFSKRFLLLNRDVLNQFDLLKILARFSLIIFIPIWLYFDFFSIFFYFDPNDKETAFFSLHPSLTKEIFFLLVLDGTLNYLQNIFAFTILNKLTPLTYSVVNSTKRIFIITLSILVLNNPVTIYNFFGICLSIFGVFIYNRIKLYEKDTSSSLSSKYNKFNHIHLLPTVNLNNNNIVNQNI